MRGWSFRLAERIAAVQGGLLYANLAVRGATTREIVEHQLARAVAMRPELATLFSGTNDVLQRRFDVRAFASEVLQLQRELRGAGATVLTFTLPDLTPLMPLARAIAPRIHAMNDAVRSACAETGTKLLDFAALPLATDARLWNEDRIHANAEGHARIAAALAETLGLLGADSAWRTPLPELQPASALTVTARELAWCVRHLLPWCAQALLPGRRAFAGRVPTLTLVSA